MNYKRLGRCGLKVGAISLGAGSWGTATADEKCVREMMAQAMDMGIIYFDNAESYANGNAEVVMGKALRQLGWSRIRYVVSTKFFWGLEKGPNQKNTLNRKYLLHAIEASLKRSQLDYVDIAYCHRPDPHTPIEETVWAFHNMIERGYALYWGTSEWSAQEIQTAIGIAERHSLRTLIIGASRLDQIVANVKALDLVPRLTPEVFQRIDNVIGDYSESWVGGSPWHYDD